MADVRTSTPRDASTPAVCALALARGVDVIDLDDPAVRDAVVADPALALSGPEPLCIDEYQKAPEILDALKARLNRTGSPRGAAVLTGSTRHDALPRTAQALTGRLHTLRLLPLSQGELDDTHENLIAWDDDAVELNVDKVGLVRGRVSADSPR